MTYDYSVDIKRLPEVRDDARPLGRHVHHDNRSRMYPHRRSDRTIQSVRHNRTLGILEQTVGSCTGEAATGLLGTAPLYDSLSEGQKAALGQKMAEALYHRATQLDPFTGEWPPNDTGSDGLSVAKAAVEAKLSPGYTHCFSFADFCDAMQDNPVMAGTAWKTGMDNPSTEGQIRATGDVRGGHEYEIDGLDVENQRVYMTNSWGNNWGMNGRAWMTWADFDSLLHDDGDVTVLLPLSLPAPVPVPPDAGHVADGVFAVKAHQWLASNPWFYRSSIQTPLKQWLKDKQL